jgi:hypothetical protein
MDEVKEVLDQIEKRDGVIIPEAVVNAAENEDSPIHSFFEWDDSVAAEAHRLWQARRLIKTVVVNIEGKEKDAFYNVVMATSEGPQRGYVGIKTIRGDEVLYDQVVRNAVMEIKTYQRKYKQLTEIKSLINQEVLEQMERTATHETAPANA